MQLLEGDESRVTSLYHKVATGPRHSGSMVLLKSHADTRRVRRLVDGLSQSERSERVSGFLNTNPNDREFFAGTDLLQFF